MKNILVALCLLLATGRLLAQPHFGDEQGTLTYRNQEMMINPAYVGSDSSFKQLILGAKGQWVGVDGAPQAQNIQFQLGMPSGGIGAWVYHESYGVTDIIQLMASYAYRVRIGDGSLLLGLQAGALTTMDGKVTGIGDLSDPAFAEASPRLWGFNTGVGAYYHNDKFYAGFSVPQLLTNDWVGSGTELKLDNSFVFNRLQFYLTGGYVVRATPKLCFIPTALLQFSGTSSFGYEVMVTGAYDRLFRIGAGYGAQNSIRAEAEVYISREVGLSYRYEQNVGDTYKYLSSTHSLALSIIWDGKREGRQIPLF